MGSLIIFDLDGTLIDSRRDLAESTNEMLASFGAPALPIDQVAAMVGEGARVLVERALTASGLDPAAPGALPRFLTIYDRRLLNFTRPYPGIARVVRQAAAHAALAVVTNKPEALARRLLDAFDLRACFRWVIGGDAAFPRKPDPASVRFLMAEAAATPAGTLLVGDSAIDVLTARAAGVRVCVARYGFGRIDAGGLPDGADAAATPGEVGAAIARFLDAAGRA
ncbi:MAG: HAD-IA family hydrolase [Vicinamibacterales bacterium]